jgi:DNA ligase-1
MQLNVLVEISQHVRATSRRNEKVSLVARALLRASREEIAAVPHYLSGQIPQGRFGVAWKMLHDAAQDLSASPRPLSLVDLDTLFKAIAGESGPGSKGKKTLTIRKLLSRCDDRERSFVNRLIMGEIREGAMQGLVLEAVAQASSVSHERIRQALMFSGDIRQVAHVALEEGSSGLSRLVPRLFHPISPMLASPSEREEEAVARLGKAGWEYKIDGARVQIHKRGDEVRIYTRHLKQVTESVPEIVDLPRTFMIEEAIFEAEVIALRDDGKPLPFQTTMRRFGRVREVAKLQAELPHTPYFFDLLYLDGVPLFETPYEERIGRLARNVASEHIVPRIINADPKKARDFLWTSWSWQLNGDMAEGEDG